MTQPPPRHPRRLITVALSLILVSGIAAVGAFQLWRGNQPLEWLSLQDMLGICQAVASLEAFGASRISESPDFVAETAALEAAQTAVRDHYPSLDFNTALFSEPLLVAANLPGHGRTAAYLIFARLKDALPGSDSADVPIDQRLGAAAVLYLHAETGEVLHLMTAMSVSDPYSSGGCLRHMANS